MKKIAIALTALSLLAAGIGTASAASLQSTTVITPGYSSMGDCNALTGNPANWDTTGIADKLSADGVQFDSIGTFGNCFIVKQTSVDGTKAFQLYDPSTLNPIHL